MTRLSKKARDRSKSPKRCKPPSVKSGPKKDNLSQGYKEHYNALGEEANQVFIPRIK